MLLPVLAGPAYRDGIPVVPLTNPVLAARRSRHRRAVLAALVTTAVLGGGFAGLLQPQTPSPPVGRRQVRHRGTSGAHHTPYGHAGHQPSDSLARVLSASRD